MTEVEIKDIAIIIGGLITAISTLLAIVITNMFNLKLSKANSDTQAKQKLAEQRILKIEETYLLSEKWETNFSKIYIMYLSCYLGKLNYKQVLDMTGKSDILAPGEAQKLKMLIFVHFPELASDYEEVNSARGEIARFLCDPKDSKLNSNDFIAAQENLKKLSLISKKKLLH
ncbi:MAG: hypothetical protein KKD30_00635 [Gammaproteobacteria bacterium]|nr:hypothetical protein [Gammaproteobacteria bacterium]MBU0884860.1 hypothetical protein [Gammaproteobacteria bacterium]MBU1858462.1 hypothetical protein [Gammaproteobacteria bacterium]